MATVSCFEAGVIKHRLSPLATVFKGKIATRELEPLYEIGCAREQHAPSILDQSKSERSREMALAAAGRAEEQNVGALLQQASPDASAMT